MVSMTDGFKIEETIVLDKWIMNHRRQKWEKLVEILTHLTHSQTPTSIKIWTCKLIETSIILNLTMIDYCQQNQS